MHKSPFERPSKVKGSGPGMKGGKGSNNVEVELGNLRPTFDRTPFNYPEDLEPGLLLYLCNPKLSAYCSGMVVAIPPFRLPLLKARKSLGKLQRSLADFLRMTELNASHSGDRLESDLAKTVVALVRIAGQAEVVAVTADYLAKGHAFLNMGQTWDPEACCWEEPEDGFL
eukprot:jgi/Botrbrau1/9443/Bobra.0252s0066.1